MPTRSSALVALLLTGVAFGHPQGFHKKLVLTASLTALEGLVVMDVDAGERCRLIRQGADTNHDGVLDAPERQALKARLVAMATRKLSLSIAGAKVPVTVKESKLSLREDFGVGEGGLSVAVLLDMVHPHAVSVGMGLSIEDSAPDFSHVEVRVEQLPAPDAGVPTPVVKQLEDGERMTVRLEALGKRR